MGGLWSNSTVFHTISHNYAIIIIHFINKSLQIISFVLACLSITWLLACGNVFCICFHLCFYFCLLLFYVLLRLLLVVDDL